jgi:hypothetical protein
MDPFACPNCQAILILPDRYAGASIPCPSCQNELKVPPLPGPNGPTPPQHNSGPNTVDRQLRDYLIDVVLMPGRRLAPEA